MKTISVQVSDTEYSVFGLSKEYFFFSELADIIERNMAQQALKYSVNLAKYCDLSTMNMDEISAEVNQVRQCTN